MAFPSAALHVSDDLSENDLGNNRGNAQPSALRAINHQGTLKQVIFRARLPLLSDSFATD